MAYFTTNLVQNPRFQNGSTGYVPLLSTIGLTSDIKLFGASSSMMVETSGITAGEGIITPQTLIPDAAACSLSLFLQGEGTVNVSAVVNPGGTIVATVPVNLTNVWQRVVINDIEMGTGEVLFATVTTDVIQATTFVVSGVQIEPESPANDYCDGDIPGCQWLLGGSFGISVQPFQNSVTASGISTSTGNLVHALDDTVFSSFPFGGFSRSSGKYKVKAYVINPVAAMDDFSVFQATDNDPAQTYVGINNALSNSATTATPWSFTVSGAPITVNYFIVTTGQSASIAVGDYFTDTANPGISFQVISISTPFAGFVNVTFTPSAPVAVMNAPDVVTKVPYNRIYSVFYPPLDYTVSNGQVLWSRAAFGAIGFQYLSVPGGGNQTITDVQTELLPLTTSVPSNYSLPRQIKTIVKPNRLNFHPNPSIETSTAGWSAIASASISRDTTVFLPDVTVVDDVQTSSLSSLKITLNTPGDGATITVSNLIVGLTYIASAYVRADAGISNIIISCANGSGSAAQIGLSADGFGSGTYGGSIYGGVVTTGADLQTGVWFRPSFTFTATASSHTFDITFIPAGDVAYPTHVWADAMLIELGANLDTYFDGNFGPNYFWEGLANLSRSYFYDQFAVKQQAVLNVLNKHVPLGISYATPQYKITYTQD